MTAREHAIKPSRPLPAPLIPFAMDASVLARSVVWLFVMARIVAKLRTHTWTRGWPMVAYLAGALWVLAVYGQLWTLVLSCILVHACI